jgi:twitching motility protein PilT
MTCYSHSVLESKLLMPEALLSSILQSHKDVSDLFFVVGKPLQVEAQGELHSYPDDSESSILQPLQVEQLAMSLMGGMERPKLDFHEFGACDCSYAIGCGRFRVNIFRQNGNYAIVMRKLNTAIPTMDGLKLQPVFREIVKEKTGIIFVTGATGSGKSTTLAAMLNELNRMSKMHIVTLEDPIEFMHPHQKATFSQRELGRDFPTFAAGLRSALRQAPKAILVGEIRDRDTMDIALTAAETGHVVYSTLHTINAGQTINRILGFFTIDEQQLIRERLADTLRYVVSQRLVPKVGGGRLMINEIMGSNLRTRETLLLGEGENRTYSEIIEASAPYGWRTFDRTLVDCYEQKLITEETAMIFATSRNKVRTGIDRAKKLSGVEEPGGLAMKLELSRSAAAGSPPGSNKRDGPSVDLIALPASG